MHTWGVSEERTYVYEERRRIDATAQRFDRLAFARRALRILRPERMSVAIYEGSWELRVERGRAWSRGAGDSWAMVGIPKSATREGIALALAELAGVADVPFMIDVLLADASHDLAG